jgi:predicted AAA+ superfamily ATPase
MMENIKYNELVKRGYSVDTGAVTDGSGGNNKKREIDFVVSDADRKVYIQSAFRMDTSEKEASGTRSLMLTNDFFKKIVVRMDIPHSCCDENGIFHCNLIDMLLNRFELF